MQTGTIIQAKQLKPGQIVSLLAAGCFFLALAWPSTGLAKVQDSSTWFVQMDRYSAGAHGTLTCEECHGPMQTREKAHPDTQAAGFLKTDPRRTFDYDTCKKCHKTAHERVLQGEHAKAADKEKKEGKPSKTGFAPRCGDCHSAHYVKARQSRVAAGKEMTGTCGACHPDQEESYLANYHGKAGVNLGYDKAAFCTDCHGAHTAVSLKDRDQVLQTCRRCHPDARDSFADIIIHDTAKGLELKTEAKQSGFKWVHALGTLSLIFVVAVLVFFYAHTGLLMLRKIHEKLRRHK